MAKTTPVNGIGLQAPVVQQFTFFGSIVVVIWEMIKFILNVVMFMVTFTIIGGGASLLFYKNKYKLNNDQIASDIGQGFAQGK